MSTCKDDRGIFTTCVVRHRALCREHFQLTLGVHDFPNAVPGQFVQILCRQPRTLTQTTSNEGAQSAPPDDPNEQCLDMSGPMLRRPFSIAGLRRDGARCEIDIIGRVIGAGTAWLNARSPDDTIEIIGPLGCGYGLPPSGHHALLVAGGVGLPPVQWLGEILHRYDIPCHAIYGVRSRDLLPVNLTAEPSKHGDFTLCAEEFAKHAIPTMITTEDGSCGLKGRVTDGMLRYFTQQKDDTPVSVYACGPEPLLMATASMCQQHVALCQVAMERVMACGMGTCQSCVVPVFDEQCDEDWRYALCCTEGPVFDATRIRW
ncbi:MAG: dihydroorotate dehydrogenase electron transfer subunit [Phycisphaerales bacterium]|nr:dihydroorotate dehydrogenase electron transfer subunit [Phycisphaerales bacterium]